MNNDDATGIAGELARVAEQVTESRIAHRALVDRRNELVVLMHDDGYSLTDIARVAGISYQQVQQILGRHGR
ncbi:helix-turn-helix domain-containing protein [Brevibacterium sanguinis]|uniref:helix-turn-helix domain-containing protein n=1 Tax=Brevibacterium sanguinis TaxID=232444 RepID=UPI0031DA575A